MNEETSEPRERIQDGEIPLYPLTLFFSDVEAFRTLEEDSAARQASDVLVSWFRNHYEREYGWRTVERWAVCFWRALNFANVYRRQLFGHQDIETPPLSREAQWALWKHFVLDYEPNQDAPTIDAVLHSMRYESTTARIERDLLVR